MWKKHKSDTVVIFSIVLLVALFNLGTKFNKSINQEMVSGDTKEQNTLTTNVLKVFYTQSIANLRSCESVSCESLGTYPVNTEFSVSYKDVNSLPEWVRIDFIDSNGLTKTGFINKSVLGENEINSVSLQVNNNQVAPTRPVENQKTETSQTSEKETICTGNAPALFLLKATLETMKLEQKARLNDSPGTVSYIKVADTQVGYSQSLGKCVGGYYLKSYTVTNNYESNYHWSAVVAVLDPGFNSYEIMTVYDNSNTTNLAKQYEGKLYELTNGEIGKIKW